MSAKTNTSSQNRSGSRDDTQEVSGFYDFHARGCGYMSRVRWVSPRQGRRNNEFLACAINAVHGSVDDPNYSYMDLIVSGDEAKDRFWRIPPKCVATRQVKTVASREPHMRIYSVVIKGIFQDARTVLAGLGQS